MQSNVPILVTVVNGVVQDIEICTDRAHLEQRFREENQKYGRETNEAEMDNGYVELEDATICMCSAKSPLPATLIDQSEALERRAIMQPAGPEIQIIYADGPVTAYADVFGENPAGQFCIYDNAQEDPVVVVRFRGDGVATEVEVSDDASVRVIRTQDHSLWCEHRDRERTIPDPKTMTPDDRAIWEKTVESYLLTRAGYLYVMGVPKPDSAVVEPQVEADAGPDNQGDTAGGQSEHGEPGQSAPA